MASTNSAVTNNVICHPLKAICTYLNAVSAYLYRKNFMDVLLSPPLVTEDTQIRFLKAVYEDKHVTADPFVTYKVDGYTMGITPWGVMNAPMLNPNTLSSSVTFTVSTVSDVFTEGLAFELGAFSMALKNELKDEQMYINRVDVSETKQDPKSTFYLASTKVGFSLGYPIWNTTDLEGILREVRLEVNTQ